jgi:hypothetical protein
MMMAVGRATFVLDLPMLAIRWIFSRDPFETLLLPIPGMGMSDLWMYVVFRGIEDVIICAAGWLFFWTIWRLLARMTRRNGDAPRTGNRIV